MSKKIITIVFIVFFSIMLWIFVSLSGEYFYSVKMPIVFNNVPQGYAISSSTNKEISLSLKGLGWQLAQITFGTQPEFVVTVNASPGEHKLLLRNALDENRWLSSAVQINEFSPEELGYRIEEISSKKVPIVPNLSLKFKEGFGIVEDIHIQPESVTVSGPKSLVQGLGFVNTVAKTYSNIDNSIVENVKLQNLNNIDFSINQTEINFDVQKIVDREFQNIKVEVKNIPPSKNLTVYPEKISVILRGGINLLGRLSSDEIKVSVNFNQAIRDTLGYLIPTVIVPQYTEFVDTKPNRLEYIIQQL